MDSFFGFVAVLIQLVGCLFVVILLLGLFTFLIAVRDHSPQITFHNLSIHLSENDDLAFLNRTQCVASWDY